MEEFCFLISEEQEEERIDKCIHSFMDQLSRSYIQKLVKENQVTVNGENVKVSYKVKEDDCVKLLIPNAIELDIEPEDIPLDILYEDDDLVIINKPKGMVVHPSPGHYSHTLVNAVLFHCKGQLSGINGIMRPGIVHRIDMNTTGSIIVCKNDVSHNFIAKQLKDHTIIRKYRAIVHGVIKEDKGTIQADIGRHPTERKKMSTRSTSGKHAVTHYTVLQRFSKFTYIECQLETGRTHQIRVHMSSIGHPLLGDEVYSNQKSPVRVEGQTLHAMIIGLIHPVTKEYLEVEAPLPDYFSHLLTILK